MAKDDAARVVEERNADAVLISGLRSDVESLRAQIGTESRVKDEISARNEGLVKSLAGQEALAGELGGQLARLKVCMMCI